MNKFGKAIRNRRDEKQILLRHVSASLDIDTAMLSKIERGQRKAKREQVILLAQLLKLDENELIMLWLADRVYEIVKDEKSALNAMNVVEQEIKYNITK